MFRAEVKRIHDALKQEAHEKFGVDVEHAEDEGMNPDYHLELTLSVAETRLLLRALRALMKHAKFGKPRLSAMKVRNIRAAHDLGWTNVELATVYGVHESTISRIVRGLSRGPR